MLIQAMCELTCPIHAEIPIAQRPVEGFRDRRAKLPAIRPGKRAVACAVMPSTLGAQLARADLNAASVGVAEEHILKAGAAADDLTRIRAAIDDKRFRLLVGLPAPCRRDVLEIVVF